MKRILLFLIASSAMLFAGCSDKKNGEDKQATPSAKRTSLHENHLLGKVRQTTDTKYLVIKLADGRDSLVRLSVKTDSYNQKGWLTSSVVTTDEGDTIYVMKVSFDKDGRMTRSEFFDHEGRRKEYSEYQNDSKGFRVKESRYRNDSLIFVHVCSNDPAGNVEQITVTQGEDTYYINYFNNEQGLPVRIDWKSPKMGETPYQQNSIEYDDRGNVINRTATISGRNVEFYHAQYSDKGYLLKEIYQRSEPTRLEEILTEYTLHDSHGNWTHQEISQNGHRHQVIERKTEYYH